MSEQDALKDFKFGGGLFIKLSSDDSPRKLRVVTTDPVVSVDKFGNTRFGFIAWDYNNDKAGILNTTPGVAKQLQAIHQDEDFGANIKNVDIKVTTIGSGIESRHNVTGLPKSETLTNEMIKDLRDINIDEKIEEGERMSFYNKEKELPVKQVESEEDEIAEVNDDEPINLDDIPF